MSRMLMNIKFFFKTQLNWTNEFFIYKRLITDVVKVTDLFVFNIVYYFVSIITVDAMITLKC